jgi:hypothetical protein
VRFLDWFDGDTTTATVLKAALAHLWFVTIHPVDDRYGGLRGRSLQFAGDRFS